MVKRVALLLVFVATVAGAQATKAQEPAKPPSPGDQCLAQAPLLERYISNLKASRDEMERQVTALQVQMQQLRADLDKATKPAAKP